METKITELEGISFITPDPFEFPFDTIAVCPPSCGPGKGLRERVVPECFWGLKISPVCYIHDDSLVKAEATWQDFHQINSIMLTNFLIVFDSLPHSLWTWLLNSLRRHGALSYYNWCVSPAGVRYFMKCKGVESLT